MEDTARRYNKQLEAKGMSEAAQMLGDETKAFTEAQRMGKPDAGVASQPGKVN